MREPRIRGPLLRAGILFRSNRYLGPYRKLPNTLVRAVFDFTGIFLRKTDLLRFLATTIQVSAPLKIQCSSCNREHRRIYSASC